MKKWKDILHKTIIPVTIFVVPVFIIIMVTMWIFRDPSGLPELHIPARGCLFRIETNDTPEFFNEVLVNSRLKIIIDDEVYWIRLERDSNIYMPKVVD